MPPQKRNETIIDGVPPAMNERGNNNNMRRSGSESDFSQMGDTTCPYRVRKSSLIG